MLHVSIECNWWLRVCRLLYVHKHIVTWYLCHCKLCTILGNPLFFLVIKENYVVFFILCMAMECFYGKGKVGWTGILSESSWPEDKTFSLRRNWLKYTFLNFIFTKISVDLASYCLGKLFYCFIFPTFNRKLYTKK